MTIVVNGSKIKKISNKTLLETVEAEIKTNRALTERRRVLVERFAHLLREPNENVGWRSKNPIAAGNFKWIFACYGERSEQVTRGLRTVRTQLVKWTAEGAVKSRKA